MGSWLSVLIAVGLVNLDAGIAVVDVRCEACILASVYGPTRAVVLVQATAYHAISAEQTISTEGP